MNIKQAIKIAGLTVIVITFATSESFAERLIKPYKEKHYAEPTDDAAIVYFVRPSALGYAVRLWAFVDDTPVGLNLGAQYTFTTVDPGKHLFWAYAENTSALEMEVEVGKTYYLKQIPNMGLMYARVKLVIVSEDAGKKAIKKSKYTELTESGEKRGQEIVEMKYEIAVKWAEKRMEK